MALGTPSGNEATYILCKKKRKKERKEKKERKKRKKRKEK